MECADHGRIGRYVADIVRDDGTYGENQIVFVVRDDASTSDLLFQTSDTTWEAYNTWGGTSLYTPDYPAGRAYAVSYERPFANRTTSQQNFFFADEYPMVRYLEENGYDVSYTSGQYIAMTSGADIVDHKVFLSVGHDEYWSSEQFYGVENARCRRRQSGILQRQRSLLEDALDRRRRWRSVRHDGLLQGDAR